MLPQVRAAAQHTRFLRPAPASNGLPLRIVPLLVDKSKCRQTKCTDKDRNIYQEPPNILLHLRRNEEADEEFCDAGGDFWLGQGAEDILEHERTDWLRCGFNS